MYKAPGRGNLVEVDGDDNGGNDDDDDCRVVERKANFFCDLDEGRGSAPIILRNGCVTRIP